MNMSRGYKSVSIVLLAGLTLLAGLPAAFAQSNPPKRGRKYKSPPATARIEVTIVRDFNGKPIENAAVIFHPMIGEKDDGNMELKTNEDGKTVIDVLPMGDTVRLQVIARGFQTYGEDYKVDQAEMAIDVRMKRPGEQYSIYKSHAPGTQGGKNAEPAKPEPSKPEPEPGKDTPPSDSSKPDSPSQPQTSAQPAPPGTN